MTSIAELQELVNHYASPARVLQELLIALARFRSLKIDNDIFYYEDGRTENLVALVGMVPTTYNGAEYSSPLAVWLPLVYPQKAPVVVFLPPSRLQLRSESWNGTTKVTLPYLTDWEDGQEKSLANLIDVLLSVLGASSVASHPSSSTDRNRLKWSNPLPDLPPALPPKCALERKLPKTPMSIESSFDRCQVQRRSRILSRRYQDAVDE